MKKTIIGIIGVVAIVVIGANTKINVPSQPADVSRAVSKEATPVKDTTTPTVPVRDVPPVKGTTTPSGDSGKNAIICVVTGPNTYTTGSATYSYNITIFGTGLGIFGGHWVAGPAYSNNTTSGSGQSACNNICEQQNCLTAFP